MNPTKYCYSSVCFLTLSIACRHLQNNEWLIVTFIEPVRIHRYATTLFFTLFNWMAHGVAQPNIVLSVLCDCQCPVAPQAYVKRFQPQHSGVNRLQALRDRILRSLDQGWAFCSYLLSLLAVHPQCFNTSTTVQRVCAGRTRALTFRVDHNYNSLLKFQRQPTKFSLLFRKIVWGIASVTYRAIYEIWWL